ncbi:helix-turn-helix domain-containing protein [Oceanobacillus indicireducens]|uniref:Transcriptional regulator n=1 Tax=Oceanobacillus indicireducens TaxID=1004261 RepID=A0A917XZI0_9BACI|nr:helix-turn-helix transcriptional regulator [Oceanobacillus indicireducens]GGN59535.1 transcriptional regulator [Oceanobacillus indicireducens]
MSLVERIKMLCNEKKVTFAEVERKVGISNGQIRRWDNSSPKIENVQKVADYFDVSTDYLLGRTDKKRYYDLTEKDEKEVEEELQRILNNAETNFGFAAFDGKTPSETDKEDYEMYVSAMRDAIRLHKRLAKKKFTPKKYR